MADPGQLGPLPRPGKAGDQVTVSPALHRSLFSGLPLSGPDRFCIQASAHRATGLPPGITPAAPHCPLAVAPGARAVRPCPAPWYLGPPRPSPNWPVLPTARGWRWWWTSPGAQFSFHPELPRHGLEQGAGALLTSVHRTGPGPTPASLACPRSGRLARARLERGFGATHTTSRVGSVLVGIEGSLDVMSAGGEEPWAGPWRWRGWAAGRRCSMPSSPGWCAPRWPRALGRTYSPAMSEPPGSGRPGGCLPDWWPPIPQGSQSRALTPSSPRIPSASFGPWPVEGRAPPAPAAPT